VRGAELTPRSIKSLQDHKIVMTRQSRLLQGLKPEIMGTSLFTCAVSETKSVKQVWACLVPGWDAKV